MNASFEIALMIREGQPIPDEINVRIGDSDVKGKVVTSTRIDEIWVDMKVEFSSNLIELQTAPQSFSFSGLPSYPRTGFGSYEQFG
ncbi:hypothetical protein ACK8P5_25925 (plasmid) [Paenibacillus sp. EC2-1]|uniref:hypothetical protein n=1 Tax=Paenibacillus sp. EC2-1 TaxID=3388665 RepID=UPI003BEF43E1